MIEEILLRDQTTGKNILWANAEHDAKEIQLDDIKRIEPRWKKLREHQKLRTKARAEIFTPPEICKLQNDLMDEAWLRSFVFSWLKEKENLSENSLIDKTMLEEDFKKIFAAFFKTEPVNLDSIVALWLAENKKLWETYVDLRRLEITCGEAPYLVSRYNAVTGEPIEISQRVGLLDRKLRVVNAETAAVADWINFATRAVQSVYGYDFQGDNLFLARKNVFETVKDYYSEKFSREPREDFLFEVAEIISWNLWQMDGLTCSPPFMESANLFGGANCRIKDWRTGKIFEFGELAKGARL